MSTGRIQDPEGAKRIILFYKTTAGAATVISRQNMKIAFFSDTHTGKLKVEKNATPGGKQEKSMQSRRMVLIYMTVMQSGSSLNPIQCTHKTDHIARHRCLISTLK
jgi:hypothetical protein